MSVVHDAPVTLAVIPDEEPADLAACVTGVSGVTVVQHGVDHQNRRQGQAAGEFAHDWSRLRVATQLRQGWRRLSVLPGAYRAYVPPWNDIHPSLAVALEDCGYAAWSAWDDRGAAGGPVRIDVHLDLLRWKQGVRFRGVARLREGLRAAMAERRRGGRWEAPIGLLTHHLDHDEPAWRFLDSFLAETRGDTAFEWRSLPDLAASAALRREAKAGT